MIVFLKHQKFLFIFRHFSSEALSLWIRSSRCSNGIMIIYYALSNSCVWIISMTLKWLVDVILWLIFRRHIEVTQWFHIIVRYSLNRSLVLIIRRLNRFWERSCIRILFINTIRTLFQLISITFSIFNICNSRIYTSIVILRWGSLLESNWFDSSFAWRNIYRIWNISNLLWWRLSMRIL